MPFLVTCRKDSIVSDSINYDILKKIEGIQKGDIVEPRLLGQSNHTKTKDFIPLAIQKHLNGCCESKWPNAGDTFKYGNDKYEDDDEDEDEGDDDVEAEAEAADETMITVMERQKEETKYKQQI